MLNIETLIMCTYATRFNTRRFKYLLLYSQSKYQEITSRRFHSFENIEKVIDLENNEICLINPCLLDRCILLNIRNKGNVHSEQYPNEHRLSKHTLCV